MPSYIPLTQGKTAVVDDCFFDELSKRKWHVTNTKGKWYAKRTVGPAGGQNSLMMHWEILRLAGIPRGEHTDHRDGNSLNNQLDNLRPATASQNHHNRRAIANSRSGYKGVSPCSAKITVKGKLIDLGCFRTTAEATDAYISASRLLDPNRGVTKCYAKIVVDGKQLMLGYFDSVEEAARAYDAAALKYYGEFACLNFPELVEAPHAPT